MILDSDEEEPPPKADAPFKDDPQFEDEEAEIDPLGSAPEILQYLDFALGTSVLHVSFPASLSNASSFPNTTLPMVSQQLIVAAACSDHTVRVLTVPLTPPSPAKKTFEETRIPSKLAVPGDGTWGEQMLTLGGHLGCQDIPTGLAISLTPRTAGLNDGDVEIGERANLEGATSLSRPENPVSQSSNGHDSQEWDLLVASVSSEAAGLLLVYRVPVVSSSQLPKFSTEHRTPSQTQHLSSPALTVSFNPSSHTAKRHSQLLIADSIGCVRLYDCSSSTADSPSPSGRPGSDNGAVMPESGSWLLCLHLGSENFRLRDDRGTDGVVQVVKDKQFLDAKWALGGKAIIVLLSNGEWGLWDVEGVGPNTAKSGDFPNASAVNTKGIRGGARTAWNVWGRIETLLSSPQMSRSSSKRIDGPSEFAPRTPRTRKVGEQILFSGASAGLYGNARGRIVVQPRRATISQKQGTDTVVFWFADSLVIIPNLWSYWEYHLAKLMNGGFGNLLDSNGPDRLFRLDGVHVKGETINDVDLFPCTMEEPNMDGEDAHGGFSSRSRFPSSVLVSGGHHMVVLSGRHVEQKPQSDVFSHNIEDDANELDVAMSGELGIDGIDQFLDNMDHMDRTGQGERRPLRKKVGFVGVP